MVRKAITVFCFFFMAQSPAFADPICQERALTAEEVDFYDATLKVVTAAFPIPNGWVLSLKEDSRRAKVCEDFKNYPMIARYLLWFKKLSKKEIFLARQKSEMAGYDKRLEKIKKEVPEVMKTGDVSQMEKILAEMNEAVAKAQKLLMKQQQDRKNAGFAGFMDPEADKLKNEKIDIQVVVNDTGEKIGKKYDIPMAGVVKAFETGRGDDINRKIYIGHWNVVHFDNSNWKLSRKTIAHTQAKTLLIVVKGKKARAEKYLNRIDMGALKAMVK